MAGRLICGAFGAILAAISALLATVTPEVLQRVAELQLSGLDAFAALAMFGTTVVGGFLMGVVFIFLAALPRKARK
jgi:hypothetical protein